MFCNVSRIVFSSCRYMHNVIIKSVVLKVMVINLKSYIRRKLARFPEIYIRVLRFKYQGTSFRRRIVDKDTEIVIEGYPRSGNSFAKRAFLSAQIIEPKIATHSHSAAQVEVAVRLKLPIIVVVRNPRDAIPSFYALRKYAQRSGIKTRSLDVESEIVNYIEFNERIRALGDNVVLAIFDEVVEDFGGVVCRVNERWGTTFGVFAHSENNVKDIFENSRAHLSPNSSRIQDTVRGAQLYEKCSEDLKARAERIFNELVVDADRQRSVSI